MIQTDEQLYRQARIIAERVMGWRLGTELFNDCWMAGDNAMWGENVWNPWMNEYAALVIADRLNELGYGVIITNYAPYDLTMERNYTKKPNKYKVECNYVGVDEASYRRWRNQYRFEAEHDSRPQAIFLAAAKVAEQMEVEKDG